MWSKEALRIEWEGLQRQKARDLDHLVQVPEEEREQLFDEVFGPDDGECEQEDEES